MYRVIEVARMLGVSKVTIYKKMRYLKDEIKPFVVKQKNVTHITDEGVELIKSTIQVQDYENENKDRVKLIETEKKLNAKQSELEELILEKNQLRNNNQSLLNSYYSHLEKTLEIRRRQLRKLKIELENNRLFAEDLKKQYGLFVELNKQSM